jgi:hypothetical protein
MCAVLKSRTPHVEKIAVSTAEMMKKAPKESVY